jgi:CRISPR system Cascade subunit CasC
LKSPIRKEWKDESSLPKDAADVAIFGRMVANDPSLNVEGAAMFGHALSTHKADNDIDFFAAVDDKRKEEDSGAGMIGTIEFTSAVYYRYAALNLGMLVDAKHLGKLSADERRAVVDAFIRAALLAVPTARRNSMNGDNPPAYVLGIYKDQGQPMQLINAFEKPVWSKDGLIDKSIAAMKAHHAAMQKTWDIKVAAEVAIPDVDLNTFCKKLTAHVP